MRVVVLHNAVSAGASADDRDVLVQARVVTHALERLGHDVTIVACDLDLAAARDRLLQVAPDVVFNLVESLGGAGRLAPAAAALVELLGLPCTGAPSDALFLTGQKLFAKHRLQAAGISTPGWTPRDGEKEMAQHFDPARPHILKSVWEDASFGLGDDAVVSGDTWMGVRTRLDARIAQYGGAWFAETYIAGREFNVALLAGQGEPQVLPIAEIEFVGFAAGKPRIVGYRAKWDESSFEYAHTPRRFDFLPEDEPLLATLREHAVATWRLFDLCGYARVDFRVDVEGRPWVLEANANPCLSPDAGFAAALARAGVSFESAVARIVADAVARRSRALGPAATGAAASSRNR